MTPGDVQAQVGDLQIARRSSGRIESEAGRSSWRGQRIVRPGRAASIAYLACRAPEIETSQEVGDETRPNRFGRVLSWTFATFRGIRTDQSSARSVTTWRASSGS